MPLADALATLRSRLPPTAVLVGQNIAKDVEWLGLSEGRDYAQARTRPARISRLRRATAHTRVHTCVHTSAAQMVDLAALLRVFNPQYGSYTYFSQARA